MHPPALAAEPRPFKPGKSNGSSPGASETRTAGSAGPGSVRPHDFRAPAFVGTREWRQLRKEQEGFAEALAGRLRNDLRLDLSVRLVDVASIASADFLSQLPEPTNVALFRVDPLRGVCVLEVAPALASAMVDRLMGGPGEQAVDDRGLSEIELALLDQVLQVVVTQWSQHWARFQELRPTILGHENSARYLQIGPGDAVLVVVVLEIFWNEKGGELRLAFPAAGIEPLLRKLAPSLPVDEKLSSPAAKSAPKWNAGFSGIKVDVSVEWPARQLHAGDVAQLSVGDVLQWDPAASAQVLVKIAKSAKFVGRLGVQNGQWAIQVTGPCPEPN